MRDGGGDPCSPGCLGGPFPCDDPCAIDPCSAACAEAPCNPECGGDPCGPGCDSPPCHALQDCDDDEDDEPAYACVGDEKNYSALNCPSPCTEDCDPGDWEWESSDEDIAIILTDPPIGLTIEVEFVGPGVVSFSASNDCCGFSIQVTSVEMNITMDANRDGAIDPTFGGPDDQDEEFWEFGPEGQGAIILFNNDDDDANQFPDAYDDIVNGPQDIDDLTPLLISRTEVPDGCSVYLEVFTNPGFIRIFNERDVNAEAILTPTTPWHQIPSEEISGSGPPLEYGIEATAYAGADFDGLVMLSLRIEDDEGEIICEDFMRLRVAPWMMPSHLDPVTEVYVTTPVAGFPARLLSALSDTGVFLRTIESGDYWPQDQYEIGFHSAPGDVWQSVLLNSPRLRSNLPAYAESTLLGPAVGVIGVGPTAWHTNAAWYNTYDSFGNLECFPPVAPWTVGRIYHGHGQTDGAGWNAPQFGGGINGMKSELVDSLAAQVVQDPIQFNTSWLAVGHVDEFMTIQWHSDDTFSVIMADPVWGQTLLESDPNYQFGDELWDQQSRLAEDLISLFEDFQAMYKSSIDAVENMIVDAFGPGDVIYVPAFFACFGEDAPGVPNGTYAMSALPDMVNLLNVNNRLIVPDPFYAPFRAEFQSAVGVGVEVRWIDCREYHWGVGEVHCGTNVVREPRTEVREWWNIEP